MMNGLRTLFLGLLLLLPACGLAETIVFDFEDLTLGTEFSAGSGNLPGDLIQEKGGVQLTLELLLDELGGPGTLEGAQVVSGQRLILGGAGVRLDFRSLPRLPRRVEFDFEDPFSRISLVSLGVNDSGVLSELHANVLPVRASFDGFSVVSTDVDGNGSGSLIISATGSEPIESFYFGSASQFIDNVRISFVPEPTSGAILIAGALVDTLAYRRQARKP